MTDEERKKKKRESDRLYREKNKEYLRQKKKEYYEKNKEEISVRVAEKYQRNKVKIKAATKLWKQLNRDRHNAICMTRIARKLQASPKWEEELSELVFIEAQNLCQKRKDVTGFSWEMDHIIPLKGKEVCGLHVYNNIQVIPQKLNSSKRNRYFGNPEHYKFGVLK